MQNSSLQSHKRVTKIGLNLSSSAETAMTAVPGKCLKATAQSTRSSSGRKKATVRRLWGIFCLFFGVFFVQRGKARHRMKLQILSIFRLASHGCDYKYK